MKLHKSFFLIISTALMLFLFFDFSYAQKGKSKSVDLGTLTPGGRELVMIAIPTFEGEPGAIPLKENLFSPVIYKDLELSGYFVKPKNQSYVEGNFKNDKLSQKTDFLEWGRLGASFLLLGTYASDGSSLSADVMLFDVGTGKRIFGKKFQNFSIAQQRTLAHKISDEIVYYITHIKGVANTKILFISDRTGNKEVWIMDADGANQRQITRDKSICSAPCWGKNATEIYYTTFKEYNPDLCGTYLDGSKTWFISSFPGLNVSPSWSDKTERIVLTLSKDGNSEIYSMDRNGKNLKRLTYNNSIDSTPSWSPSGTEIIFTSDRTGTPQLYTMNSEGFNVQRLTFQGKYNDGAMWSPKGDKIAFHARAEGTFNIYLSNPAPSSEWIQLTYYQDNNEDPCWAPDGQHLVFSSNRTGKSQIFLMHVDGTGQTQLTTQGNNTSAAWSPYLD